MFAKWFNNQCFWSTLATFPPEPRIRLMFENVMLYTKTSLRGNRRVLLSDILNFFFFLMRMEEFIRFLFYALPQNSH